MKIGLRGGHSPNCKGAMGIIDEQAEVRKIYHALKSILESAGHIVIDCNSDARYVTAELKEGTDKANAAECDIYMSIHMNAASNSAAGGTEIFLYDTSNLMMNQIAGNICNKFSQAGFVNRGVKFSTGYHDLSASAMPAMIVETLFCTSVEDTGRYFKIGVDRIAQVIAEGFTGKAIGAPVIPILNTRKGEITMVCFYRITDLDKDKVYYFDGHHSYPLMHPDERKVLNEIYKANNGRDIPEFFWTSKAPWFARLKGALDETAPNFFVR